ncbi:MAG: hypothetical protein NTY87_03210 [Planctomycetia bacterium]|nr:hypothetical protein [Planctomycetia bacterium]RLT13592.1 MAG: hypothetical protein DWI25_06740 [Planctomycetota bacterium]
MSHLPTDERTSPLAIPRTNDWQMGVLRGNALENELLHAQRSLVLKLGGSLLAHAAWPRLVTNLLQSLPQRPLFVIVGGGAIVEGLRAIDAAAPQPSDVMHALAIHAMGLTARLVARVLGLPLVEALPEGGPTLGLLGAASTEPRCRVLDVPAWLASSKRAASLPVGWHVTSDSIAAHATTLCNGDLLLAKSVPPPPCPGNRLELTWLAKAGWVDHHFHEAAVPLASIGWAAPFTPQSKS